MRIHLLAVGQKMPEWVNIGYHEFAGRIQGACQLQLTEIVAEKRTRNSDARRLCELESQKLLTACPKGALKVALDVTGKAWSTEQLASQMEAWMMSGRDVSLFVGGPEGLSDACRKQMDQSWSLSPLTFPHPLVRVVVAEQLYRALSIINNHPYHRAG